MFISKPPFEIFSYFSKSLKYSKYLSSLRANEDLSISLLIWNPIKILWAWIIVKSLSCRCFCVWLNLEYILPNKTDGSYTFSIRHIVMGQHT